MAQTGKPLHGSKCGSQAMAPSSWWSHVANTCAHHCGNWQGIIQLCFDNMVWLHDRESSCHEIDQHYCTSRPLDPHDAASCNSAASPVLPMQALSSDCPLSATSQNKRKKGSSQAGTLGGAHAHGWLNPAHACWLHASCCAVLALPARTGDTASKLLLTWLMLPHSW